MTPDERRHYLRMAGTPITLLALVILIAVAIRAGWKAVSAPVPPPPITPCVNQDVKGKLTTKDVTVSVYNSGHTRGLAGSVSKQLANVGFVIDSVANREPMVKGVTVIGHNAKDPEVKLVAGYFPAAVLKSDPKRVDHEVEVVLGDRDPNFKTDAPKFVKVGGPVCLPSPSPTPSMLATPGEKQP
ncbi:LytR C-terminal domain-containing protein [Cutibacterium avidum]|uniref:LytR/CpsA/Psr regulator C-terminal domain-containing protein n=1 Tax=Cutibacterium avidum TaxID=33010 RepID=A0A3E2DFA4_9ACTN|nr:LytR C-terminal domain-containing protein [Cutibacterium avidum]MBS5745379.1 LytR C-terminal domain-containing protein [Propionibacterium sp.]MDU7816820.1 LytR C-terminal domain-containing protein [Bacillota bacterium]MDK7358967.1 LytR C-terminal domain-containing protein [Cutibacterium avidum]MDK7372765.1 LytR C-terminal domain-containing protein [Cutibacterium avidum]MDU2072375.1 LytR C-terminal domain-containing protein [Cutibacterium avidum]